MSYIYLIQSGSGGPVKIGLTTGDPAKRLAQLQTGNPMPLAIVGQIYGDRRVERHLHTAFQCHNLQGEWFAPAPAIFAAFEAAADLPANPVTLPPVTQRGIGFLREILRIEVMRSQYPDGTRHDETDWDDLAVMLDDYEAAQ